MVYDTPLTKRMFAMCENKQCQETWVAPTKTKRGKLGEKHINSSVAEKIKHKQNVKHINSSVAEKIKHKQNV